MKPKKMTYLPTEPPPDASIVYSSALDVMEEMGWTVRVFEDFLKFSAWWNRSRRPTRVSGAIIRAMIGRIHIQIFRRGNGLMAYSGKMTDEKDLVITHLCQTLMEKVLSKAGEPYVRSADFDRITKMRIADDVRKGYLTARCFRPHAQKVIYLPLSELARVHEVIKMDEPVQEVVVERIVDPVKDAFETASPQKLLALLEDHENPILKGMISLYSRENIVPFGVLQSTKEYLQKQGVL